MRGAIGKAIGILRDGAIGRPCGGRATTKVSVEEIATNRSWIHPRRCLCGWIVHTTVASVWFEVLSKRDVMRVAKISLNFSKSEMTLVTYVRVLQV